MNAVETAGLCKRYGRFEALRDVHLVVPEGARYGFLGPNGSGKSTTIRILLGLLRATSGTARALGGDAWRDGAALRGRVGYLPGELRLYDGMTGSQTLRYFAAARRRDTSREVSRLAEVFGLALDRRVRAYSRGMKQKLGLIAALMHEPELLILDEPTTGLDPLVRHALFDELRRVSEQGRTVVFSSHTLSEVDELCDHVGILRGGRLVAQERVEALRGKSLRRVEALLPAGAAVDPPDGLTLRAARGGRLEGTWRGSVGPLVAWLASRGALDVVISPPELEDLFLAYYAEQGGEAA
ncbi:MAG: Vitamin B12 import ATP-binding protein BtuD [Phycisphaerae bacterium]|nr:Vitamin B12 import ATP-binding protein BtuD [Phycisphaerae bacterium]